MIHFTFYDVAVIVAFYAWPVIAGFTALMAVAGWLRPSTRQRRDWRITMRAAALVLLADTLVAAPFIWFFVQDQGERWLAAYYYTYRLDEPQMFDGTLFPAGSEVSTDPEHRLRHGKVPVPTKVFGLDLIGEFSVLGSDVESGTLASEGLIKDIPCGPGPFRSPVISRVRCTLARDVPIKGLVLRAGTVADITRDSIGTEIEGTEIEGTLAQRAQLAGLSCGGGPMHYLDHYSYLDHNNRVFQAACLLDGDQTVNGFPLAGGHFAALMFWEKTPEIQEGTLSTPLQVLGAVLPAGTEIKYVGNHTTAELQPPGYLGDLDHVSFILPAGSELSIEGATLVGAMEIEFRKDSLSVARWEKGGDQGGTVVFAGKRHGSGWFNADGWHFD